MSIQRKPSKLEQKILLSPLRAYLEKKYNIVVERNDTIDLKPPYILLSNHVNNWDPLFINCYVNEPICFVAAAPLFRNKALKKVLDYTGAISKTKSMSDTSTIRNILKAKKNGRAIALFPEGNRTWNGHTEPLYFSTSKLIKLLNIPVITVNIKGGYLSHPRWADTKRKGQVVLSFEKKWDINELKDYSVEEIHDMLTEALRFDEIAWQKKNKTPFIGERLANYLERYLFTCPNCKTIGKLESNDDIFSCNHCNYTVRYNENGRLEQVSETIYFTEIHQWNDWQINNLDEQIQDISTRSNVQHQLTDKINLLIADKNEPFKKLGPFTIRWENNALHLSDTTKRNTTIILPLNQLDGVNVQLHQKLDFFHEEKLYRLDFFNPRSSAYKWYQMILLHLKLLED